MNRSKVVGVLMIVAALGIAGLAIGAGLLVGSGVRAQDSQVQTLPTPKPRPTPVNQHWRVEYGEVEGLENRLHMLNARGETLALDTQIRLSNDCKRFVILISDADADEDAEGR